MAACCGLLNCFGASASRKPLRDMHEQDGEVVEVLPPFWNNYPHSVNLTTETVRANLYALNLMVVVSFYLFNPIKVFCVVIIF